jgi:hypothetical protein
MHLELVKPDTPLHRKARIFSNFRNYFTQLTGNLRLQRCPRASALSWQPCEDAALLTRFLTYKLRAG